MSDFTGTFRQFSSQHPVMTERPRYVCEVVWSPYTQASYTRYNYSPANSWNTFSGAAISTVFGSLVAAGLPAYATVLWDKIPQVSESIRNHRSEQTTLETWKRVDVSAASTLVSALEAHKSLKLLTSKGRALIRIIEAAKNGEKAFRSVLTEVLGRDIRKRPLPRRYLIWDPSGSPITNRKGTKVMSRYGHASWTDRTDLLAPAAKLLLEYRYGWQIMVMEIVDQLKAFYADDDRGELLRYKNDYQVARVRNEYSDLASTQVASNYGGITYQVTTQNQIESKIHAWIRWRMKTDPMYRRLNDFGIFDLSRSLWDIIPLSFLVDMLADVSGFLQAVDAYLKADVLSSGHSVSFSHTVARTCTGSNASTYKWQPMLPTGCADTLRVRIYQRENYLGLPRYPTVNVKATLYNVATVAALLKSNVATVRALRV